MQQALEVGMGGGGGLHHLTVLGMPGAPSWTAHMHHGCHPAGLP